MSSGLFWTDPSVQTLALDLAVYIPSSLISFVFGSNGKLRPSADYFVRHASAQPPWLVSVPATGLIDYLINDSLAKFPMRFAYIILVPWKSRRGLRLRETNNFYYEKETNRSKRDLHLTHVDLPKLEHLTKPDLTKLENLVSSVWARQMTLRGWIIETVL